MPTFTELVQDLPLELFDEIKALTFTVDGDDVVELTKDYKPPVQLQIDRISHAAFAEKFYAAKTFLLPSPRDPLSIKWFELLDRKLSVPVKKLKFPVRSKPKHADGFYYLCSPSPLLQRKLYCEVNTRGFVVDLPLEEDGDGFWMSKFDVGDIQLDSFFACYL